MNYRDYYVQQGKSESPVFSGATFQRGYGFGDVFKRFFKWIVPVIKQNAVPALKNVGKKALKTAVKVASDTVLDGKNLKTSAKERIKESLRDLTNQTGDGYKRKCNSQIQKSFKKSRTNNFITIKSKKKKKKRNIDIFDKKWHNK